MDSETWEDVCVIASVQRCDVYSELSIAPVSPPSSSSPWCHPPHGALPSLPPSCNGRLQDRGPRLGNPFIISPSFPFCTSSVVSDLKHGRRGRSRLGGSALRSRVDVCCLRGWQQQHRAWTGTPSGGLSTGLPARFFRGGMLQLFPPKKRSGMVQIFDGCSSIVAVTRSKTWLWGSSWFVLCANIRSVFFPQSLSQDAGAGLRAPRRVLCSFSGFPFPQVLLWRRPAKFSRFFLFLHHPLNLQKWCSSFCPRLATNLGNDRSSYVTTPQHDDQRYFPSVRQRFNCRLGGHSRQTQPGCVCSVV